MNRSYSEGIKSVLLRLSYILGIFEIASFLFVFEMQAEHLIKVGDLWRYCIADQSILKDDRNFEWTNIEYNDSAWAMGVSGFGNRYWDDATTVGNFVGISSCILFRKKFYIDNPDVIKWLILRLDYEDGFIAYINGCEVARKGITSGGSATDFPFMALADYHSGGIAEDFDISGFVDLLKKGTNILTIALFNNSLTDYSLSLVPELLANFSRGPFIQAVTETSVTIVWKTINQSDSRIDWGTTTNLDNTFLDHKLTNTHVLTLTGLSPGTRYYYRIISSDNNKSASSEVYSFKTFSDKGKIKFATLGDTGSSSIYKLKIANELERTMVRDSLDLVFLNGDLIYPEAKDGTFDLKCFSPYANLMKYIPFYVSVGNHDRYYSATILTNEFYLPTNNIEGGENYYSFDAGCVHFIVLDSDVISGADVSTNSYQYRWLEADLKNCTKPWKIFVFHEPYRSSGPHHLDDWNYNRICDSIELYESFGKLAEEYGVDLVINAHDHYYERIGPVNGVHFVISGGGGGPLYRPGNLIDPFSRQIWVKYNFIEVTVDENELLLKAIDEEGNVFDSFVIGKTKKPNSGIKYSVWQSIQMDETGAYADGNYEGQTYNFVRDNDTRFVSFAITGRNSNLGALDVSNDDTNLYIGLSGVMINSNNVIFLFLGSSDKEGVPDLKSCGNKKLDPYSQGADGLDFLTNLCFTNFSPVIGCILGDEWADANLPAFGRTGCAFATGQGIFRLDSNFTTIDGSKIQQFNRSPQIDSVPWEQDADFIKLSIPLRELGKLSPEGRIKIAAVVGVPVLSNEDKALIIFDKGFIGENFFEGDTGLWYLEGIDYELAQYIDPDNDGLTSVDELKIGTDPMNPDTDGDGLPDGWEIRFGLNPLSDSGNNGAEWDLDMDGMSNYAEYISGTDPTDSNSVLKLSICRQDNSYVIISWPVASSRNYTLSVSDRIDGPYTNLFSTNIVDNTLREVNYRDKLDESSNKRFYRLGSELSKIVKP